MDLIKMQNDFDSFRKDRRISGVSMHDYKNIMNVHGTYINPTVIEERQMNVTQIDVFSRLMMDRIIFLGTGIDDTVSNIIVAQLLFLQSIDASKDIDLYINSGGGIISSGLAIYDTMNFIKPDVNTLVTGMAASMAFVLSISGKHRSALKHARLMQHQPSGGASGTSTDIQISAKQIDILKKELYHIIADKTKQPYRKIYADCERDYWMTAEEAKKYGAIDTIL